MGAIASQISSLTIVYLTVYSDADQSKHQSSASLAFVREIHRGPVNLPHNGHTVGSLNADILRHNADIISATLKLWGKLDENVSWVNTFHLVLIYLFILSDKT